MFELWCSDLPKFHPKRVALKISNIAIESICSIFFKRFSFGPSVGKASENLSTTKKQKDILGKFAQSAPGPVVEIGAWEGETTRHLAQASDAPVYAVDLYFEGWPPAMNARDKFTENTRDLMNVFLIRLPSITASKKYEGEQIGLLFIDGQHNFLNTMGDYLAWRGHLAPSAYVAFHDVDNVSFPGTRIAAKLISRNLVTVHHSTNLLILQKRS